MFNRFTRILGRELKDNFPLRVVLVVIGIILGMTFEGIENQSVPLMIIVAIFVPLFIDVVYSIIMAYRKTR